MPQPFRVQIDLARHPSAILTAAAAARSMSEAALAKSLLETSLLALSISVGRRAEAEGALMRWVEEKTTEYKIADIWDEHVTLVIFDRIRTEIPQTYDAAIVGRHRVRINRGIGRLIRNNLGAATRRADGVLQRVQLPTGAHLITGYTCLFRN